MQIAIALESEKEGRPISIQIYFEKLESLLAEYGVRFCFVDFGETRAPAGTDIIWAPGLGNRRVPPVMFDASMPTVATIHGLQHMGEPPRFRELGLRRGLGNYLWMRRIRSDWSELSQSISIVISVHQSINGDIINTLFCKNDIIHVISHGVDEEFFAHDALREPNAPIVHLSQYSGVKNIKRLIDAYAEIKGELNRKLIVASLNAPELTTPEGCILKRDGVRRDHVAHFIGAAHAYASPSVLEPFGMTVLEAMALGTPVLTSVNTGAADVAGDAAVLVDPHDVGAIANGLIKVCNDDAFRRRAVAHGRERARTYSWRTCAEKHWRLFNDVLEQGG